MMKISDPKVTCLTVVYYPQVCHIVFDGFLIFHPGWLSSGTAQERKHSFGTAEPNYWP